MSCWFRKQHSPPACPSGVYFLNSINVGLSPTGRYHLNRCKDELVRRGEEGEQVQKNVVDGLAQELINGTGLAIALHPTEIVALHRRPAPDSTRMAAD